MGNPQHVQWLSEGVNSWNTRRRREHFTPDLEGEDLTAMFNSEHGPITLRPPVPDSKGIDLSQAKLNGAILENLDLSDSSFTGAYLNDARLMGSHFKRSSFWGSRLNRAHLNRCNLESAHFKNAWMRSADLSESDLRGATFIFCHLEGANFFNANLGGTDFPLSRPWEARLYSPYAGLHSPNDRKSSHVEAFSKKYINSIDDLLKECRDFRNEHGDELVLYFRGEDRSTEEWELRPSVMRKPEEPDYPDIRLVEGEMLNDLITREPESFNGLGSSLSEWVLARHYFLPTRFLDITRNPLVALFNACSEIENDGEDGRLHVFAVPRTLIKPFNSDTMSVIANFAKLARWEKNFLLGKVEADAKGDEFHRLASSKSAELLSRIKIRLYDGIRQEKPYFAERIDIRDLFRVFVVEPQRMFERIKAQSGAFLISAFHERFEEDEVMKWNPDIPMYSHYDRKVRSECKESMREDLRLLNITQETLFPSVDESAKAVKRRYRSRDKTFYDGITPIF